ncbi:MAG: response regulator [Synechocystis sp.]
MTKPKILIVDDRPEDLQVLLHTLKQDYAVIAATTGEKALQLAATSPLPELILLDVMMPDLDGYQVCQRLKADPLTQDIPIIFVSALEDVADETKGFELGAVDYITKPISPPVVKARLKSHLTLRRLNQALVATNQDLAAATRHKDEFLAHMSHELRTPLTTILGFTEALQYGIVGLLNEKQEDAINSIDVGSQHLLSLINDILDLSKMVAGKVELHQTPTAIAELCRASLLFVQRQAQQKNIQLDCVIPDNLDLVLMDARKIKQALINLGVTH